MQDLFYHKILAYKDELITQESSYDEYQEFLMGISRPDFANRDVIAVKFVYTSVPGCLDYAEESNWYINTNTVKVPPYCTVDVCGSKLPPDYPPYLLVMAAEYPQDNLTVAFDMFDGIDYTVDYLESFKAFTKWFNCEFKSNR